MREFIRLSIGVMCVALLVSAGCEDSGASYTTADLAGTWNYVMRTPGDAAVWKQGTITFDAAGNLTAWTEAEWKGESGSGQLHVSGSAVTGTLNVKYTDTGGNPTTGTWTWDGEFATTSQIETSIAMALVIDIGNGTAYANFVKNATLTR